MGGMAQRPTSRSMSTASARAGILAALLALTGGAFPAEASTFLVEPTQIFLSARTTSVLLTLRNQSDGPLRFELSAFGWTQSPSGEIQLEPTDDVVFFPSLLTLAPGETRRIRVGRATGVAPREKTYRIFVEELPPLDEAESGVRVLTKMGIPIFVRPAKEVASATLNGLGRQGGALRFSLTNDGTVHFVPRDVRVRGLAGGAVAFEQQLDGWYVLAGGRRDFTMDVPAADCSRVTAVVINVQFGSEVLEERLQTPGGICSN